MSANEYLLGQKQPTSLIDFLEWGAGIQPETTFITRIFFAYSQKHGDHVLQKRASDMSPTTLQTAGMIEMQYEQLRDQHDGDRPSDERPVTRAGYVLCETLKIAALLDSCDYQGSKKMKQVICTFPRSSPCVGFELICVFGTLLQRRC